jgi:ABC-2 type transport system ATP-binding protein
MMVIVLDQLTKRYGAQTAVDALSFEIPAGQIVGFLGPNGAGKSTTLKMLTGMIEPSAGRASICGYDLQRQTLDVKRHVGFVPESGAVFESLTGLEYLEMVAALYGIPQDAARARIKQFIAFFDLSFETLTDKLLGAYSKGMRRKVVITSALLHNPPVVFFDEPLDGLDANAAVGFKALIQTLAREGKTIVYSSHVLDVVERVCHRVIIRRPTSSCIGPSLPRRCCGQKSACWLKSRCGWPRLSIWPVSSLGLVSRRTGAFRSSMFSPRRWKPYSARAAWC